MVWGRGGQGLCCCWGRMGRSIPCGFINLRAAVFKGLKGVLSLETPALYNGGLFPCWGCDFIWRKWLRLGEGTGHFLVWGCHKAPPLALLPQGTASVPFSNLSGGAHGLPSLASPGTLPGEVWPRSPTCNLHLQILALSNLPKSVSQFFKRNLSLSLFFSLSLCFSPPLNSVSLEKTNTVII